MFSFFRKTFVVVLLALFVFPVGARAQEIWCTTREGAKVLAMHSKEIASWSVGVDAEGYATGQGILKFFIDGSQVKVYEGTIVVGKINGKGILTLITGSRYEGDFVDGKLRWSS